MNIHQCLFDDMMKIYEVEICGINLRFIAEDSCLIKIEFLSELPDKPQKDESTVLQQAGKEIKEYLKGERKHFSVNYKLRGTEFQKLVWRQLVNIPYGETLSYGEIARRIGKPKAARAVGRANHVNPLPFIIPCHRVIGSDGTLTGYEGGLDIKQKLLNLESKVKKYNST